MIPACLSNRSVTVAVIATVLGIALCAASLAVPSAAPGTGLPVLANAIALRNAPLCICLLAWGILIVDADRGYSAARVQYACMILFFGTTASIVSALRSLGEIIAFVAQVLSV